MIRVVVLDFDGSLVDSNLIKERMFERVAARHAGGLDALAEAKKLGGDRFRTFGEVSRRLEAKPSFRNVMTCRFPADYGRACLRAISATTERRGASAALRYAHRRGLRFYLNTAKPQADVPAPLRARGWARLFSGAYGAPGSKVGILEKVLRQEQVEPRSVVMVGDSADDLEAARQTGAWFAGIATEARIRVAPPFGIADLRQLPVVLRRLDSALR